MTLRLRPGRTNRPLTEKAHIFMAPTRLLALALASTALAASGCGGGGNSGAHASNSGNGAGSGADSNNSGGSRSFVRLTRAELIARADAICRRVVAQRDSIVITSPTDEARVLPPFAAYQLSALAALARLYPPSSMGRDWNKFLASFRTLAADTEKVAMAAQSNSLRQMQSLSLPLNDARKHISVIAARDGLPSCSQIGS
jgi:hypothetical protein